jgi:hypothetical protein
MRVAALHVDGVELDEWTISPFFVLEGGHVRPRPPDMTVAGGLAEADVASFPAVWSSYVGPARDQALRWLDRAADAGTTVIVWVDGDQEIDLDHPAAFLFEQGPSASRRPAHARVAAWPVLVHDYVAELYDGVLEPRPRGDRPVVGFCGQAAATAGGRARLLAIKLRDRARHATGRTDRLPAPLTSHLRLRRRALDVLAGDPRIDTDFIVRDEYRAGVRSLEERVDRTQSSSAAFFDNIARTQYTVCLRGGGNFSKRLYEVLCLGRLPVIVDTDQLLPWHDRVDWAALTVVVDHRELDQLADRVVAHHAGLDDAAFADAQRAARELWVDRLSVPGFFARFREHLDEPA